VLEVARGGILRRGLPVRRADAALVTDVANDHLGEYGIFDLEALADAKMVVANAIGPEGRVVLNADDERLLARGLALNVPVTWFTLDPAHDAVRRHVAAGGDACVLDGGDLVLDCAGRRIVIASVTEIPVTLGGAARHNVANALAAIALGAALRLPDEAIAAGLRAFQTTPAENPGRANLWEVEGAQVIVDFAHNPHGLEALTTMAASLPAKRRAIVIGQAGDRDDQAIAEFARAAWRMRPDRVFIKEMEKYLRGRERGVIPAMIEHELRNAGAPAEALSRHDDELEAVRAALEWAREGDVLLLTVHAEREAVIALVESRASTQERAG
jgi:UDP-N-acetylmuramyl tripeptide synthase